jgi:hypothetical protein
LNIHDILLVGIIRKPTVAVRGFALIETHRVPGIADIRELSLAGGGGSLNSLILPSGSRTKG